MSRRDQVVRTDGIGGHGSSRSLGSLQATCFTTGPGSGNPGDGATIPLFATTFDCGFSYQRVYFTFTTSPIRPDPNDLPPPTARLMVHVQVGETSAQAVTCRVNTTPVVTHIADLASGTHAVYAHAETLDYAITHFWDWTAFQIIVGQVVDTPQAGLG
jgi:hypothetical protein